MNKMTIPHQKQTKLWAVIPAAGSGRRFSATDLKQYQIIQNKTVLEHSIERLSVLPLAGYVLAIAADDDVAQNLALVLKKKAHFCQGGAERVYSVLNALNYLSKIASDEDWVLVHDAARPCVSPSCLETLYQQAIEHQQSAILAIPVRDTLKRVVQAPQITETVSREQLWQAQTPQIAQLGLLKSALEQAIADQVLITDEASALEHIQAPVQVITGRADNIKITYPSDLDLARLILQAQQ
ncbi:2-C-methyl-D-erythritol 4-phosphate cytidylyltransferase [Acinetobacter rudis]|uniref:2-C-methyl-D-erythritol 4-phosphate cytidylyltransferase n=1 Tax=Acinetobacter rudis CIP 110305 TaxID=421052 RepID=S3MX45_9GAMM|nr:2-C-methyl-D-erythritol 4-phosphate cytidylyltransferase [Acinetobacter rudis]EPF72022.1 2-C-methyl-D-erythritol 4-phosphate cytidylyltransferase [Acinetobacter rudis CIP 110305]